MGKLMRGALAATALMLGQAAGAQTYNAGIAEVGADRATLPQGQSVGVFATLRNLQAIGIFTVHLEVLRDGAASPVHTLQCRTPELATGGQYRCAGSFSAGTPGTYRVRARAGTIDGSGAIFPGSSGTPGTRVSAAFTVSGNVTPPPVSPPAGAPGADIVIDSFGSPERYNQRHQNLLGGYTDDDGSLQHDMAVGGALQLRSAGSGYWYSVLAKSTCLDASKMAALKIVAKASQAASLQLSLGTGAGGCERSTASSAPVTVQLGTGYQEISVPLNRFQLASLAQLQSVVLSGLQAGVDYGIQSLSLVATSDGLPPPQPPVGLPAKVVAGYWPYWPVAPVRIRDVHPNYNVIYLFHARPEGGAPGTTGAVVWTPPGDGRGAATNFVADIQHARTVQGRKIILSVGGAGHGMSFPTRTKSQAFVDSVVALYNRLGGFDGLDWNTFEADQAPDTEEMIWISLELKRRYPGFIITSPPAPWSTRDQVFCQAMVRAGAMDYAAPQYYDGPGLADPAYVAENIRTWVQLLGAERVVVGFGVAAATNYMTIDQAVDAWQRVKAQYPQLRGGFDWQIHTDESQGWPFATRMKPLIQP
ncbi:glycosyl hydrolase family 18 protein [Caldimonas brevitalea]|uniref:Chitinase n=1 Tax=Caldimonas brevitalea TaxID=413882 RepID=A0A0G3BLA6_9BURK|nr:glycosyl hydrolase family 18 protein [Caldimonas brevitalea]AKJ30197.1 chitinase [Caldimonas brevitalea]